ncbi:unnamed protein product [Staurois parvus]|uniref:Uncharacterized protein n=1 Tax=Staurois parvus TaxID=386267 RepID=A0ABN9HH05_9NEOB|nr:unnamed protein product [Staurois parvus]
MRCPWYLFHRLFCVWARTQGPHDPLLPGGPMSCQSALGSSASSSVPPISAHQGSLSVPITTAS